MKGDFMEKYTPPFTITNEMLSLVASISEKIGKISIGDNTFIGADTIVMPNVKIGKNCIIGTRSVVTKDVPDNTVYAGNPAKFICTLDDYIQKNQSLLQSRPVYDSSFTLGGNITDEKKTQMI